MTLKSILSKALGHKRPAPLVVHQSIHLSPGMDAKAISRITESTIHEMIRGAR